MYKLGDYVKFFYGNKWESGRIIADYQYSSERGIYFFIHSTSRPSNSNLKDYGGVGNVLEGNLDKSAYFIHKDAIRLDKNQTILKRLCK